MLLGMPEHHRQRQDLLTVTLLRAPEHRRSTEGPHALGNQAIGGIRQHQEPAANRIELPGGTPSVMLLTSSTPPTAARSVEKSVGANRYRLF